MNRIACVFPNWRLHRRQVFAMDVLAHDLARSVASEHVVVMYVRPAGRSYRAVKEGGVTYQPVFSGLDEHMGSLAKRLSPAARPERPVVSTLWAFPGYAATVAGHVRRRQPDVVHTHIFDQFLPLLRRAAPNARLVLHMHDHSQVLWDREVVGRHLSRADLVVGCSNFVAGHVRERFPHLAERVVAIPNATAIPDQHQHQTSYREETEILFAGRLSPDKGVHVLIDAFNRVHAEYPGTRLTLVGPTAVSPWSFIDPKGEDPLFSELRRFYHGQDYSAYLRTLPSPDAAKHVRFVGAVPHPDMGRFYDDSDILVLPSIWNEPFGLPVIEAMARSIPVVTTTRGAFPEIVEHGTSGLMVEPGDSDALATALGALIADEGMRTRMGAAARERASAKFSWDRYVAQWQVVYAEHTG